MTDDDGTRNFRFDRRNVSGFYSTTLSLVAPFSYLRRGLGYDVPGDTDVEGPDLLSGGDDLLGRRGSMSFLVNEVNFGKSKVALHSPTLWGGRL